ncbi:hypothetical protein Pse7367_1642 [Thalassoporum mexicanum PCC 7367]|uniref:DUF2854 domain-containing protein n=1 Tax=Thalassoporum mexicanum TaxID=3457544 RepID=UPI00029FA0EE|nr:DUF2854 domain-containing protein [Pseudanabaena sp. PCC 7367]AFY69930.1 hypothetical protein Pse7367_1642 [Pseudanabaena sp. PCC 7367]
MLGKFSLASLALVLGTIITVIGFAAYVSGNSTLNLIGFFYGIPILLGGLALKSAEIKPAQFIKETKAAIAQLRQDTATDTQKQILKDVTRYRYGIEAHLDVVLEKLGLSPTDQERPVLLGVYEEAAATQEQADRNGAYTLVLRFESPLIGWETWQQKQEKFTKFFGPGIVADLTQPEDKVVDLKLVRDMGSEAA